MLAKSACSTCESGKYTPSSGATAASTCIPGSLSRAATGRRPWSHAAALFAAAAAAAAGLVVRVAV
jgi:hypothetical protein